MYNKEEDPGCPVGVPSELFESIERLRWVRSQLSFVRSLPEGKLRDNVLAELNSIIEGNISLRVRFDASEKELNACKSELDILHKENTQLEIKLERISKLDDTDVSPHKGRIRTVWVIILVVASFLIGLRIG